MKHVRLRAEVETLMWKNNNAAEARERSSNFKNRLSENLKSWEKEKTDTLSK